MIRYFLFAFVFITAHAAAGQTVVYFEDFSAEANGATNGTASGTPGGTWSVTTTPSGGSGSFSKQSILGNERFSINGSGTEGVWQSNSININGLGLVGLDITLVTYYASASDYVRAYYVLDGGPEILFGEVYGGSYSVDAKASVVVSGTSLRIVVRAMENTPGQFFFVNRQMRFDDVTVTRIGTLYSRATGSWLTGTTWSTGGHSSGSCGCTPDNTTSIIVGNGHTVDVNGLGDVVNVTVSSGGVLHFSGSNELNIVRGGSLTVATGGSVTASGAANQINFDYQATNSIVINGSLTVGDIEVTAPATLNISGSGSLTVTDDILLSGISTINNSMTGAGATIQDIINFGNGSPGSIVNNTGLMSINNGVTFNDQNNRITNSGTLTIGNEVTIAVNTYNGNQLVNNGTFNLAGVNANDGDLTITNNATINQSGNVRRIDAGSVFTNSATGTWNWNYVPGNVYDADMSSILNCSATGNTFRYNGSAGTQYIVQVPYYHLAIANAGTKRLSGDTDVNGNITVDVGTFNSVGFNLNVAGNFTITNNGQFTEGVGTVIFDGSSNQTFTNANGETFYGLTVAKSGYLIFDAGTATKANVSGILTLTNGKIQTTSTTYLTITATGTSTTGNANSFVDGPMRKVGNNVDPFVFPVGDGNVWARIGVDYVTVSGTPIFEAQYSDAPYGSYDTDGSMENVSGKEYWNLTRVSTTTTAKVQLFWESASRSEIDDITTGDLVVAHHNGTDWVSEGQSAISGLPITTGSVTSSTTLSSFSPFTFGSLSYPNNPLPITLDYFTASLASDHVRLQWKTLAELNNKQFVVERAVNAEEFAPIGTRDGQGTTNNPYTYELTDREPIVGNSYYRLKQIDFDGTVTYSEVRLITFNPEIPTELSLTIYPNPVKNNVLSFELIEPKPTMGFPVTVLSAHGAPIYQGTLISTPGQIKYEVELPSGLPAGLYFLRIGKESGLLRKFVIE
ncbi:T9SS type A sorting domain-containing protein [Pseudochryseolinea flava]|uniref:Secretion system C-terminal sorting domain-containing protein n=1 Tax=Pseudochryseolinea flava TaxID=2059302 RepID=A0A364YBL8_9BACT|nr:T9SS type A sorting domain-containing protein [Pseudochryseolinea flava]RAW03452.1 hypothetical protein DQQ10_05030 [Pseudochryseolinea flava]